MRPLYADMKQQYRQLFKVEMIILSDSTSSETQEAARRESLKKMKERNLAPLKASTVQDQSFHEWCTPVIGFEVFDGRLQGHSPVVSSRRRALLASCIVRRHTSLFMSILAAWEYGLKCQHYRARTAFVTLVCLAWFCTGTCVGSANVIPGRPPQHKFRKGFLVLHPKKKEQLVQCSYCW